MKGSCVVVFSTKGLIVCRAIVKHNCLGQIIDLAVIVHHKRKPHNHCSRYPRARRVVGERRRSHCGSAALFCLREKLKLMDGLQARTATHLKVCVLVRSNQWIQVSIWKHNLQYGLTGLLLAVPLISFSYLNWMKRKWIWKGENKPTRENICVCIGSAMAFFLGHVISIHFAGISGNDFQCF